MASYSMISPIQAQADAELLMQFTAEATEAELRAELTARFKASADDLIADAVEAAMRNIAVRTAAWSDAALSRDVLHIQTTIKVAAE